MRITATGDYITAPRALLISEVDRDEPGSCAVLVLVTPVVVAQGAQLRVDGTDLVITDSGQEMRRSGTWEMRFRRYRLL